jgi:hypothetical protein
VFFNRVLSNEAQVDSLFTMWQRCLVCGAQFHIEKGLFITVCCIKLRIEKFSQVYGISIQWKCDIVASYNDYNVWKLQLQMGIVTFSCWNLSRLYINFEHICEALLQYNEYNFARILILFIKTHISDHVVPVLTAYFRLIQDEIQWIKLTEKHIAAIYPYNLKCIRWRLVHF